MDLSALSSVELSRLCANSGDPEAWNEFVRRFQKPIAVTVLRVSRLWGLPSHSTVDDLVQETYLRLCADQCTILRNFTVSSEETDSLRALVRVVAANVAHDFFRNKTAQKRGGAGKTETLEYPDEDLLSDVWRGAEDIQRHVQLHEIERVLRSAPESTISSRDRVIFRLYFRQGLTAAAIAAIPALKLSTKGVESAVYRVSRFLRESLNPKSSRSQDNCDLSKGDVGRIPIKGEGA